MGRPHVRQKLLVGASCFALFGATGDDTAWADVTIPSGTTVTTTQNLNDNENATVKPGGVIATTGLLNSGILGSVGNTITNEGTITTSGSTSAGIAALSGATISNSGTITILGPFSDAIFAGQDSTITNTGVIEVFGIESDGIEVGVNNRVTNEGSISTSNTDAFGILAVDFNEIVNLGSITTSGNGSLGIAIRDSNTLINEGSITTSGDGAVGIDGFDFNTVTQAGTVTTMGNGADGLLFENDNWILNSGTITASGVDADGIEVNDRNTVINTGSILMTGVGSADAIEVDDDSTVINTGTLFASGSVLANGIDGEDNTRIFNTGSITSVLGSGIDLTSDVVGSTVDNAGTVSGGNGISIEFGSGDDVLTLANGSVLDGLVAFDAGTASLVFRTGNHTVTSTGTTPTITAASDIFFVQNGNTVTSLDQDLLGLRELEDALIDHSFQIHQTVRLQSRHNAEPNYSLNPRYQFASRTPLTHASSYDDRALVAWGSAFGGTAGRHDDGAIPDSSHEFWGTMGGIGARLSAASTLGIFGGFAHSQVHSNDDRTEAEASRYFGGVYGAAQTSYVDLNASIFGGLGSTKSARHTSNTSSASGVEFAQADIDSWFASASFALSTSFPIGESRFSARPLVSLDYLTEAFDGYTEEGAFAALSVEERSAHTVASLAELTFVRQSDQLDVSFGLGAEVRHRFGDKSFDVSLLSTPFTVTPDNNETGIDGVLRLNILREITSDIIAFLDISGRSGSATDLGGSAHGGINVLF